MTPGQSFCSFSLLPDSPPAIVTGLTHVSPGGPPQKSAASPSWVGEEPAALTALEGRNFEKCFKEGTWPPTTSQDSYFDSTYGLQSLLYLHFAHNTLINSITQRLLFGRRVSETLDNRPMETDSDICELTHRWAPVPLMFVYTVVHVFLTQPGRPHPRPSCSTPQGLHELAYPPPRRDFGGLVEGSSWFRANLGHFLVHWPLVPRLRGPFATTLWVQE